MFLDASHNSFTPLSPKRIDLEKVAVAKICLHDVGMLEAGCWLPPAFTVKFQVPVAYDEYFSSTCVRCTSNFVIATLRLAMRQKAHQNRTLGFVDSVVDQRHPRRSDKKKRQSFRVASKQLFVVVFKAFTSIFASRCLIHTGGRKQVASNTVLQTITVYGQCTQQLKNTL